MKFIRYGFIFLLPAYFLFTSCQKEVADPNAPTGDSTLLSGYVEIDTTIAPPYDTIGVIKYFYDNLKRCSGNNYYEYNGNGTWDYVYKTSFTFSGNSDTKLTQKIVGYHGAVMTDSMINYYQYNANDDMITDSLRDLLAGTTDYVKHFFYSGNTIVTAIGLAQDSLEFHTHVTRSGTNITSETDTNYHYGNYNGSALYTALYDNHPNPFYQVNVRVPYLGADQSTDFDATQKNNTLSWNESTNGFSFTHLYQYKYNNNGYPKDVIITEQSATGTSYYYKGFFYYTE